MITKSRDVKPGGGNSWKHMGAIQINNLRILIMFVLLNFYDGLAIKYFI